MSGDVQSSKITSEETPHLTIFNYPFSERRVAFGFSLGEVQADEIETFTLVRREIISRIFATKDSGGRFFALTSQGSSGIQLTSYPNNFETTHQLNY